MSEQIISEEAETEKSVAAAIDTLKTGNKNHDNDNLDAEVVANQPLWQLAIGSLMGAEALRDRYHYQTLEKTQKQAEDYIKTENGEKKGTYNEGSSLGTAFKALTKITGGSKEEFVKFLNGVKTFLDEKLIPSIEEKKDPYNKPSRYKELSESLGVVVSHHSAKQ